MHYEKEKRGYIYAVRQKLQDYIRSVLQILVSGYRDTQDYYTSRADRFPVKRSPPLFSQSEHRKIHVQACCSDKWQSRPTRKKPFKHATRASCDFCKERLEFQNGSSDDRLQNRRGTAWTAPVGAHTSHVNVTSYLTSIQHLTSVCMTSFSCPNCAAWRTCRNKIGYDNPTQIRISSTE